MPRIDPQGLYNEQHEALLEWLAGEGLDGKQISAQRFSVHNGWISGFKFASGHKGGKLFRNKKPVLVPFKQRQKHSLPEGIA